MICELIQFLNGMNVTVVTIFSWKGTFIDIYIFITRLRIMSLPERERWLTIDSVQVGSNEGHFAGRLDDGQHPRNESSRPTRRGDRGPMHSRNGPSTLPPLNPHQLKPWTNAAASVLEGTDDGSRALTIYLSLPKICTPIDWPTTIDWRRQKQLSEMNICDYMGHI